jgi:iron complex transport system substrate-binding protein
VRRIPRYPALALVLALVVLTGCGSPSGGATAPAAPATASAGAVVEHKFGSTEVPANVERVATVGWNDQDFVLSLGVVPVVTRAWFDDYDTYPWVQKATGGTGVEAAGSDGIDYEAVAAARPDLILAIYESIDQPTYDRLSKIAPTVVQSADYADEETPWDVQLLTTGKALSRDDRARTLVEQVDSRIAEAKAAHPAFAGKVLVEDFGPENGGHYLIGKGDPRRTLFDALGFDAQETTGDVSEEQLSLLDRDILFVNGATAQQMAASPVFSRLAVVRDGRTLYTTFDSPLSGALSYSGPDALLYALDVLVPQLANAVEGRPVADLSNA